MPNSVVNLHRASVPNDPRTDAQLTQEYGESANSANLQQQYPDFAADYQAIVANNKAANQPSLLQDFGSGVSSGTSSLASTAYGLGALGSSVLGSDSLKNYFAQKAQASEADAAANQPSVSSIDQIHGASDIAHYLFGQVGQLAPNLAEAAVTGTAGALIGGAAGEAAEPVGGGLPGAAGGLLYGILEKSAVKKLILDGALKGTEDFAADTVAKKAVVDATKALGTKYGTHLAETLNFWGQSAGSTYNTLSQDPNVDPSTAINVSILGGLAQAVPAQILPSSILKTYFGGEAASVGPYYVRLASQAAKLVPAGMAGMSLQELASIASDKYADPATRDQAFDITSWSKADRDRLVNASAVGGLAGLIGAPVAAIPEGAKIPDAVKNYVGDLTKPENQQVVQDLAGIASREVQGQPTLNDKQAVSNFTSEQRAAYVALKSDIEKQADEQPAPPSPQEAAKLTPDSSDLAPVVQRIASNPSPLVQHPELNDAPVIQKIQQNTPPQEPTTPATPEQKVAETLESHIDTYPKPVEAAPASNLSAFRNAATAALNEEEVKPKVKPAPLVAPKNPDVPVAPVNGLIETKDLPPYAHAAVLGKSAEIRTNVGGSIDSPDPFQNSKWQRVTLPVDNIEATPPTFKHRGSMTKGPIVIGADGEVIDGNNRLYEARQRGDKNIEAFVEQKQSEPHIQPGEQIKGFTFKPASSVNLEGAPPELADQIKEANRGKEWELTDRRKGSPTEGLTTYVPEGSTREQMAKAVEDKVATVGKVEPAKPEFQDWRIQGNVIRHSKVGEKLSKGQADEIMGRLEEFGTRGRYDAAKGTVVINSGLMSDVERAWDAHGSAAKNAAKDVAAKAAVEANKSNAESTRQQELQSSTSSKWIDSTFGPDAMNSFNKLELSKFLEGKTDKFGGQSNPKWRDGLSKLGATSLDDVKKAYEVTKVDDTAHKITPDSLDFARTGVAQKSTGKVQEPVYFEIKPGDKNLEDRLVSGARDTSGKGAYQNTRRLTAFEKDGKVYLLSTFKDSKYGEVRAFDPESKNDKKPNAAVSDLIDRGYQPIASLRIQEAQKNFSQVYPSKEAFEQHMGQPARDRVALEKSQIAPEPSQTVQPPTIREPFNEDHASVLWQALGQEKEVPPRDEFEDLVKSKLATPDGIDALGTVLRSVHDQLGDEASKLTTNQQIEIAIDRLYEHIATGYSEGEEAFTKSASGEFGEPNSGDASSQHPSPPQFRTPSQQEGGGRGDIPNNPASVEFEKPVARQKPTELLRQDVTARHAGLLNNIHVAAIDAGLNVVRISQDLSGMAGDFAKRTGAAYDSASRTVAQVVADVVGREDIVTSFHEVGHDVFSKLSPEMSAKALAAVDSMGDRQLGVDLSSDPRIRASNPDQLALGSITEERLVESTALRLTDAGFDPSSSKSFAQQFVRALKDLYFRAAMAIQRSLFGDQFTSGELALQYFENRVKQFLAGDFNRTSFLDMVGGGNAKQPKVASWHDNGKALFERLGLDGKSVDYQHVPDDSESASRLNNLKFRQPDQDEDDKRIEVEMRTALINHQEGIIEQAAKDAMVIKAISETKGQAGKLAPADYLIKTLGLADPKSAKIEIQHSLDQDGSKLDYDKAKSIDGFKGRSNADRAAHDAYVNTQAMASKVAAVKSKALETFDKMSQRKDKQIEDNTKIAKEHADMDGLASSAGQSMRRQIKQFFASVAGQSKKLGSIEQQLRAIDPRADLKKYGPVFQKLFTGDELKGERIAPLLDKIANDPNIDLSKPMIDIRRAMFNDPAYAHLVTGTPESNALTATMVAYAKTHERQMANLELRRMSNGEERQKIVDGLDNLKQQSVDYLKNIPVLARTAKLQERVRNAYARSLQDIRSTNRRMEQARQRITAADAMEPVLKDRQAELAGKLAIGVDSTFGDGMQYAVPLSKEAPTDDLLKNRGGKDSLWQIHKLTLDSSDQTKVSNPEDVEGHLRQMAEFLNERESAYNSGEFDAKDTTYQSVKNSFDEIAANKNFRTSVTPSDRYMWEVGVGPEFSKASSAIGTPAARSIEVRGNRYTSTLDAMRPQVERIWRKTEQIEGHLIKLMPENVANKRKFLQDDILNTAKKTMQSQHGLEEKYADKPEALKAAIYNRVMSALLNNDAARKVMSLDKSDLPTVETLKGGATKETRSSNYAAWREGLINLIEHHHTSSEWLERQNRGEGNQQVLGRQIDTGNPIKDEKLKAVDPVAGKEVTAVRKSLAVGPYTFPQKLSNLARGMGNALKNSGWFNQQGDSLAKTEFGKISDAYSKGQDPHQIVDKYFAHEVHGSAVRNDFFGQLAQQDTQSNFDGPKAADGETVRPADVAKSQEAYDQSGGDPLKWAEAMYDLHGGQDVQGEDGSVIQNKGTYVQSTMERLAELAEEAGRMTGESEPDSSDSNIKIRGMSPDFALNARRIEHLPGSWFDYHSFDQRDTFNMAKRVAAQNAFGRNSEGLAKDFDTAQHEVHEAKLALTNVTRAVQSEDRTLTGKALDKAIVKKLSAGGKDGAAELKRLQRFTKAWYHIDNSIGNVSSYFRKDNSPDGSVNTITRIAHFIGSMMINQPSSAISLMTQLSDVNMRYGASKSVVGASLRSFGSAGKEVAASMAQAVGLQMFKGGELHDIYYRLNLQDPEMVRNLRDSWSRMEGEGKFAFALRAAHDTLGVTLNRKGEDAQHVPLQPFKPFDMVGSIVDQKITEQVWQLASQHISKGIDFMRSNLDKFADPNFKLDADTLGLKGASKDSFMRLTGDMKRWDLDYNDMVRNSMQRGDNTPYTNAEALKLHSMAVSEIALRGSLSRSSASWYNNNLIRLAAPLIRWSFDRMVQVGGLRLNAEGKKDMNSFGRGIAGLSLAAGGGLAVSALLDQYYAQLLGKQRNLRPIVNAPNPEQFALGVMEDLSRVGTFGMFGELANSLVGLGQGGDNRVLSVDQRVLAVSSLQSVFSAASSWYNQGLNADYPHVVRPLAGAVGLGGLIQYMQLANNALGLDNQEARVTARINAQNYLRVVGRQLGMDVRVSDGGTFTPTPITPYMTRMELAAYKNSPSDFREAYQQAIQASKEQGHDDPIQYVKSNFSSRNPLRAVFSTTPSQTDYEKLLANMPGSGAEDVSQAVRFFNQYAASIGAKEFTGKTEKQPTFSASLPRSPLQSFRERATAALQ